MNNARIFIVFCFVCIVFIGGMIVFFPPPQRQTSEKTVQISYTVQEIDGCEYIWYDTATGRSGRRLLHKSNCINHQ